MNLKTLKLLMFTAGISMFSGCSLFAPATDGGVIEPKTTKEFNKYFENPKSFPNLLVDFYAHWCQPCRELAPVLAELSKLYPDVVIIKVNVDNKEMAETKEKFEVRGIPSLHFIKDGNFKERKRMVGYSPKAELEKKIEDHFGVKKSK